MHHFPRQGPERCCACRGRHQPSNQEVRGEGETMQQHHTIVVGETLYMVCDCRCDWFGGRRTAAHALMAVLTLLHHLAHI